MPSVIPIRNLFHMLCYAWDVLPQAELIDIESNDESHPIDLLAEVLIKGAHHLLRRGIDQDYQLVEEVTSTLRGRIDFATSHRQLLLHRGLALCQFDEISANTLPNQLLKATFFKLYRSAGLDPSLRKQCGVLVKRFQTVSDIHVSRSAFSRVRLHRNNRFYRFLLNVSEMVFNESFPEENNGINRFRDFFRDEGKMPRLYEKFILNFYRKKQQKYKVSSERIRWDASSEDDPDLILLPTMLTDISLRSPKRTIIIDAKYYKSTLSRHFEKEKIHSNNLYQIFSYLKNIETNGGNDARAEGILLYPVVNNELNLNYLILDKNISVKTLNLANSWNEIETRLLQMLP